MNPLRNPQPSDWLELAGVLIRVDHIALGEVHYALFRDLVAASPCAVSCVPLAEWLEATAEARLYAMPADDPRHHATILEAP